MSIKISSGVGGLSVVVIIALFHIAAPVAEASVIAASYVPDVMNQRASRGIGELNGNQLRASNTFTSSETGKLRSIFVAIDRRIVTPVGLTVEVFPAVVGQELADMSGSPLGSVTVANGDVPSVNLFDGNLSPAELLYEIDFSDEMVMLQSGERYAFVLSADGATNGSSVGYGFLAPVSGGNGVPGGNLAEDNGSGFNAFPFDYDMVYEVHTPEPSSLALLALGGFYVMRRPRGRGNQAARAFARTRDRAAARM